MTVLLTILKVIGWILLGILGLILLTVLTVLLVPIRYRADRCLEGRKIHPGSRDMAVTSAVYPCHIRKRTAFGSPRGGIFNLSEKRTIWEKEKSGHPGRMQRKV